MESQCGMLKPSNSKVQASITLVTVRRLCVCVKQRWWYDTTMKWCTRELNKANHWSFMTIGSYTVQPMAFSTKLFDILAHRSSVSLLFLSSHPSSSLSSSSHYSPAKEVPIKPCFAHKTGNRANCERTQPADVRRQ